MTHVGVERLGAGDGEEDAAERNEANRAVVVKERDPRRRAQRAQDDPGVGNMHDAERGVDDEEQRHDRAEERRDARRPAALGGEQQQ